MTSFTLKIIAIISMFFDHLGYALLGHFSLLNLVGRIAFPIFAFQISEGFIYTKNIKKYLIRLGIFALISQIPFSLFAQKFLHSDSLSLNVFFTLFLGLLSIYLYNYASKSFDKNNLKFQHIGKILGILIVILISYLAQVIHADYGYWGILIIFMFYILKNDKLATIICFISLCIIKYGIQIINNGYSIIYIILCIFTIFSIFFITMYNGKQGKKIKYFLYIFYPIHLLIIYFTF